MKRVQVYVFLSCLFINEIAIGAAHPLAGEHHNTNDNESDIKMIYRTLRDRIGMGSRALQGHTKQINSVAYSPDGSTVASGSWDMTVRLWSSRSGKCLHILEGHTSGITSVIFSPDGRTLASGSWDGTVRIWDRTGGECLRVLKGDESGIRTIAYSVEGKIIAAGSERGTLSVWNTNSGSLKITLPGHGSGINSLAPVRDSVLFIAGSGNKPVSLWNIITQKCIRIWPEHLNHISTVGTGELQDYPYTGLLAFSHDDDIEIYDVDTGDHKKTLQGHTDSVTSVAFDSRCTSVASASFDHTLRIWDIKTGNCKHILKGHTNWVSSLAFGPSGTLVSGSRDATLRIWFDVRADMQKITDPHERTFLFKALQDWIAGRAHEVLPNDYPIYTSLVARFAYLHDDRLFAVRSETIYDSSQDAAPAQEDALSQEDDPAHIILPPRMQAFVKGGVRR